MYMFKPGLLFIDFIGRTRAILVATKESNLKAVYRY